MPRDPPGAVLVIDRLPEVLPEPNIGKRASGPGSARGGARSCPARSRRSWTAARWCTRALARTSSSIRSLGRPESVGRVRARAADYDEAQIAPPARRLEDRGRVLDPRGVYQRLHARESARSAAASPASARTSPARLRSSRETRGEAAQPGAPRARARAAGRGARRRAGR